VTLAALMQADVEAVLLNTDEHAESVTYTPKDGTPRTISIVILPDQGGLRQEANHLIDRRMIRIFASTDGTSGINSPANGDTITRGGVVYSVEDIEPEVAGGRMMTFVSVTHIQSGSSTGRRF